MKIEVQLRNRQLVRETKERNNRSVYTSEEKIIIGHVFREDGCYTTHYLNNDPDNIARFICSSDKDKMITNGGDIAIACTIGNYLDLAVEEFITIIMPHLIKYQTSGEVTTFEEKN